jgi:hypothetical protein
MEKIIQKLSKYQTLSGEKSNEIYESSSRFDEDLGDLDDLLTNFLCKGLFLFGLKGAYYFPVF